MIKYTSCFEIGCTTSVTVRKMTILLKNFEDAYTTDIYYC